MSDEIQNTIAHIQAQIEDLKSGDLYAIFNVQSGCGLDAVEEAYTQLIPKYHPDIYDRFRDEQVKRWANHLFIEFQNAYSRLCQLEKKTPSSLNFSPSSSSSTQSKHSRSTVDFREKSQSDNREPIHKEKEPDLIKDKDLVTDKAHKKNKDNEQSTRQGEVPHTPLFREVSKRPKKMRKVSFKNSAKKKLNLKAKQELPETSLKTPLQKIPQSSLEPKGLDADQAFEAGLQALEALDFEKAEAFFQKTLQQRSDDKRAKIYLAWSKFNRHPDEANRLKITLEIYKDEVEDPCQAYYFLGQMILHEGKTPLAKYYFEKALQFNPEMTKAQKALSQIQSDSENNPHSQATLWQKFIHWFKKH